MNLQQFEHLLAVVETGSFSRAADKVHLTQPALSRSLQSLEEEIGVPLVERNGRRKTLTPVGELVAARARRIQLEVSELKRSVALAEGLAIGNVRLGLGPTPHEMLAAPLMASILKEHPGIHLQLTAGPAASQFEALRARDLDALVIHRRLIPAWDDLALSLFPALPLGFLCRAGHPLQHGARLSFARLSGYPVVASGSGLSVDIVQKLNEYFGRNVHFEGLVQMKSDEISCLLELVRTSDAVFFGVTEIARRFVDSGDMVELRPSPALSLTSQFAFVTLEGVTEPPALQVVRSFCDQAFKR